MRVPMAGWVIGALCLAGDASAQAMRGSVLDARERPVVGALVDVTTPAGEVMGRATTNRRGAFFVRLALPGTYRVRVRAIGYAQVRVGDQAVTDETLELPVVRMTEAIATLPELVATAPAGRCRSARETGQVLAPLLEAAASALEVMEQVVRLGEARHVVELIERRAFATRRDSIIEADTIRVAELAWPVVSADPERLRAEGFGNAPDGPRAGRWTFFGPDATVLFAPWFLSEHCFDLVEAAPGTGEIVVRFEPNARDDKVRLGGRLVLDATTLALRELHFEHRNLPSYLPQGSAGGVVHFVPDTAGGWRPDHWAMRAPLLATPAPPVPPLIGLPGRNPLPPRPRVVGSVQVLGRVVKP